MTRHDHHRQVVRDYLVSHAQVSDTQLTCAVDVLAALAAVDTSGLSAADQSGYDGADSLVRHIRFVTEHLQPSVRPWPHRSDIDPALTRLHTLIDGPAPEPLTEQTMAKLNELAARTVLVDGREISALEAAATSDPWQLLRFFSTYEARARKLREQSDPQDGELP